MPTKGQWWSKTSTQQLQSTQCEARGGRNTRHVVQKARSFMPALGARFTSFEEPSSAKAAIVVNFSSSSGGRRASFASRKCRLGMMPGSEQCVRKYAMKVSRITSEKVTGSQTLTRCARGPAIAP